jgi:tRNA-2-methylthio-N6-dimethylallyladenosine synthase
MNDREAQALAAMLDGYGFEAATGGEAADLIVFHTCCVRETAERRIVGKILELREPKEADPALLIGVGGCMTQQPGVADQLAERAPWLDFIYGTHNLDRVPVLVAMARARARLREESGGLPRGPVIEVLPAPAHQEVADQPRPQPAGDVVAHVSISLGCDNYCSYCIVPHVRGRERSRQPAAIVHEVTALARSGVREVTLLGQNVNSYGRDLPAPVDFAELLAQIDATAPPAGLLRVRFMTSHPKDLSPRLIDAMADLPSVAEHIHLPVQSGSDRILMAMNRRYTSDHYLGLVRSLRRRMPTVGLSTDIIVGFPGETESDFEATLDLAREAQFDAAFTFAFSRRSGTAAASLPDQVPHETKRARLLRLNQAQEQISRERLSRLVGSEQEVLFTGPSERDPAMLGGRTRGFHYVHVAGPGELVGRVARVRITAARTWTLSGELLATGEVPR